VVKPGDVVFNFLPELSIAKIPGDIRLFFVINDDFAAMAPRVSAWWIRYLMARMARISDGALYLSTSYMRSYPSRNSTLFYPWADKKRLDRAKERRVILYWGYISSLLDFSAIEEMARQIHQENLNLRILLVGPIDAAAHDALQDILSKYSCVEARPPTDLELLDPQEVLFGIEILDGKYKNSLKVEVPNKAPRLLSYGIPLVYRNCPLLNEPFFIPYDKDLRKMAQKIIDAEQEILDSIERYFEANNSAARLRTISRLIG
jgi:hypothetical protein